MQKSKFYYKVIISNGPNNHLELDLTQEEFNSISLGPFIELGTIVTVHKIYGEIQDT